MASNVARHFPHLYKNQQKIKQLLETNAKKFDQARTLFVKEKMAELEKQAAQLEKEVAEINSKLIEAEVAAGSRFLPYFLSKKSV